MKGRFQALVNDCLVFLARFKLGSYGAHPCSFFRLLSPLSRYKPYPHMHAQRYPRGKTRRSTATQGDACTFSARAGGGLSACIILTPYKRFWYVRRGVHLDLLFGLSLIPGLCEFVATGNCYCATDLSMAPEVNRTYLVVDIRETPSQTGSSGHDGQQHMALES